MEIIISRYLKRLERHALMLIGEALLKESYTAVIVPSQASFMTEKKIAERFGGFCDLEVMSFEKLYSLLLERQGGEAVLRTDSVSEEILTKRAISEHEQELKLFSSKRDELIHSRLAKQIAALSREMITPKDARELARSSTGALEAKLSDIALIYEATEKLRGDKLSSAQAERFASDKIPLSFIAGARVIIYGFDLFSKNKLYTIMKLIEAKCEISLLIEADPQDDVFKNQNAALIKLKDVCAMAKATAKMTVLKDNAEDYPKEISYLEDALYGGIKKAMPLESEAVSVYSARDPEEEAAFTVNRILKEYASGTAFKDMTVLGASAAPKRLKEALLGANIPFYAEEKRKLSEHRLSRFVLYAFKAVSEGGWFLGDSEEYLKTRIILDFNETDELLSYISKKGIRGKKLFLPFSDENAEALRKRAFYPAELLKREGLTAKDALNAFLEYLKNSDIEEKLNDEGERLASEGYEKEQRFLSQVYAKTCDILKRTADMSEEMDVSLIYSVLSGAFSSCEIAVVPPCTQEVLLADISHSIVSQKEIAFIYGANDGSLPASPPGGIFTEDELIYLNEKTFFPGLSLADDERLYIRRALCCAKKLIITYNEKDGQPSVIIDRLRRIFTPLNIKDAAKEKKYSKEAAIKGAAKEIRANEDGIGTQFCDLASLYRLPDGKKTAEILFNAAKYTNTPVRPKKETLFEIYGNELKSSASRIEQFNKCPYSHFIKYALSPQKREELEEDALNRGTYVHELLDGVSKELSLNGKDFSDAEDEELKRIVEKKAEEIGREHNDGYFHSSRLAKRVEKRLKDEVDFAAKAIKKQLSGTHAHTAGTEIVFGNRGELKINTDGADINLTGKIDRVDIAVNEKGEHFLRVVDYKTGDRDYSLSEVFYGVSIQLVVYLMAALKIYEGSIPVGGFYFHIDLPFSKYSSEERFKDMRMKGFMLDDKDAVLLFDATDEKGTLISMDKSFKSRTGLYEKADIEVLMNYVRRLIASSVKEIFSGKIDISPTEISGRLYCEMCDYYPICRFDEGYSGNTIRRLNAVDGIDRLTEEK